MASFPIALGTSFAANSGDAGTSGILDAAARASASALFLTADAAGVKLATDPAALIARRREFQVVAVEDMLGATRPGPWGQNRHGLRAARAELASLDRDEAETAVAVARAAMTFAEELGAPFVVVRLGTARALMRLWQRLRGRYVRGVLHYDDDSAAELMAARAGVAAKHIDAAMRSLDRLVEEATRRKVTTLIRNPQRPVELPTAIELAALRAELRGAPLAPLLDLPAAHLTSMLHTNALRDTVVAFGDGPLSSLADACGPLFGLVPGQGEVDVAAVARALPKDANRAFVPSPGLTLAEVRAGLSAVSAL